MGVARGGRTTPAGWATTRGLAGEGVDLVGDGGWVSGWMACGVRGAIVVSGCEADQSGVTGWLGHMVTWSVKYSARGMLMVAGSLNSVACTQLVCFHQPLRNGSG